MYAFPPLASGFKRKRMNFAGAMNGLELAYEVIDEEMLGEAAPFPATKMIGFHSETVGIDASKSIGNVQIRLDGPKGADPRVLIQRAMNILEQKLALSDPKATPTVQNLQIVHHIGDGVNAVEVKGQVMHTLGSQSGASGGALVTLGSMIMTQLGKPLNLPNYKADEALILGPTGTADFANLFACALQDPCDGPPLYATSPTISNPANQSPGNQRTTIEKPTVPANFMYVSPGASVSGWGQIPYNSQQSTSLYTFAQVDTKTHRNPMKLCLPIALSEDDEQKKQMDTMAIVRIGPMVSYMTLRIAVERSVNWPKILKDDNFTDANGIQYTLVSPGSTYSCAPGGESGRKKQILFPGR